MAGNRDKIKELEDEIKKTKYNKATQHHIGLIKAKIALLKEKENSRVSKKTGQSDHGYSVRKSGDGTVLLLGFPSAGKSTLLNKLTGSESEVGAYAFTTLSVVPGMLLHNQSKIQILDVPGIVSGAASGKGRGREVLAVIRTADLVLMVVDITTPKHYNALMKEITDSGIRVNKTKPEVYIKKTARGGIQIGKTVRLDVKDDTLKQILRQFKFNNGSVLIRSKLDVDDFIDCIEGNKKYLPSILVLSKGDMVSKEEAQKVKEALNADLIISAHSGKNCDVLKNLIFERLNFIRIFLKEPRKEADLNEPLIIQKGSSIGDVCIKLHKDFQKQFKFSRVWGESAKFDGQRLMMHHRLKDGDILEIHLY